MADNDRTFYTLVVVIALVILIGVLIFLAMQIDDSKQEKAFPPVQSDCPDYWNKVGTSCYIPVDGSNHPNTGTIRDGGSLLLTPTNTPGLNYRFNTFKHRYGSNWMVIYKHIYLWKKTMG